MIVISRLNKNTNVRIELDYDYDPEEGWISTHIDIHPDNFYQLYDPVSNKNTVVITLYDLDIEDLLKGTGMKLCR